MRKNFLIGFVMLIVSIPTFAGDYVLPWIWLTTISIN